MSNLGLVHPTEREAELAETSSQLLSVYVQVHGEEAKEQIIRINDQEVAVPASAFELFVNILTEMAQGNAVTITPVHAELTTQEAADLLNVSRPYFVRLLDEGKIPHRKVGTRRRVRFEDIMNFKQQQEAERDRLLDDLAAQAQELDMGY